MEEQNVKPFVKITPAQLKITQGGGCISIFGLPFLLAGVFVILMGLQVLKVQNASEVPLWAWPLMVLMGAVFTCVGGALVFGRTWTTIDSQTGVISEVKGLIFPFKKQNYNIREYNRVAVDFIPGDSDSADRYEVVLKKASALGELKLYSSTLYNEAYIRASFLAGFLKFSLEDNSSENRSVITPDDLEHPLKNRLARHVEALKAAYPPMNLQSRISEDLNSILIEIPSRKFGITGLIPMIISIAVVMYFFSNFMPFFRQTKIPVFVSNFSAGFVLLFFFALPLLSFIKSIVRSLRSSAEIRLLRNEMKLTYINAFKGKTENIAFSDIIDIDYSTALSARASLKSSSAKTAAQSNADNARKIEAMGKTLKLVEYLSRFARSKGITIKTTKGVFSFGQGLPDDEVLYIFSIIAGRLKS